MNNIYVVLISTNTKIGSIIRKVTQYQYNHVAISLDANLDKMYSFARYCEASALVGGFVNEKGSRYINSPTPIKVFKIDLSQDKYQVIEETLDEMKEKADSYIYNSYSALAYPLKKSVKIKNSYTCLEFVKLMLEKAINHEFVSIEEIDQKLSDNLVFEGYLADYIKLENNDLEYFKKMKKSQIVSGTGAHFFKLSRRFFQK